MAARRQTQMSDFRAEQSSILRGLDVPRRQYAELRWFYRLAQASAIRAPHVPDMGRVRYRRSAIRVRFRSRRSWEHSLFSLG
jgi:hypothetical protein